MQGSLPDGVFGAAGGKTPGPLSALVQLNMSGNALSVELPQAVWGLGALQSLDLSANRLGGSRPATWHQLAAQRHQTAVEPGRSHDSPGRA